MTAWALRSQSMAPSQKLYGGDGMAIAPARLAVLNDYTG